MDAKLQKEKDMLIIKTMDIHPEDLFSENNSKLLNTIKRDIIKAYNQGLKIMMDVYSPLHLESSLKYVIYIKNTNLDYLSDIDFNLI